MPMQLLSIDWDWVTGDCADFRNGGSHGCCGWCTPTPRALSRGNKRFLNPDWKSDLNRLYKITPEVNKYSKSNLWVAECHADILRIVEPDTTYIIHLDSHSDDNASFPLCCGSWRVFLPEGIVVLSEAEDLTKIIFSDIFVCHSSPWTPPSLDPMFWDLIAHLTGIMAREPEFIGHKRSDLKHQWDTYIKWSERNEQRI